MAHKRTLPRQLIDAITTAILVRRRTGKSVLAQFAEMARLVRLPSAVSPDEYFAMRLFDDARLRWSGKTRFRGKRAKPYVYRLNDPTWRALADDKLASLAQLSAFGFPITRTVAVYPATRVYPDARPLHSLLETGEFLRREARYPLFSKPTAGTLGRGAQALTTYEPTRDELLLKNGSRLAVSAYLENIVATNAGGTMFQELVRPHPFLEKVCGDRLATVRMLILNGPADRTVHRTVCRLPTGANMVDNFKHGELGNLLASVDPVNGTIRRVVSGTGLTLREVDRHPDTGRPFADLVLPDWNRLIEIGLAAAAVMSGIRIQGWDIALSDRGPVLLEVNFLGDLDLFQIADGEGVADDRWRSFLATQLPKSVGE